MNNLKLILLFCIGALFIAGKSFGQANPFINVLPDNSGIVAVDCPVDIIVTVGNSGPNSVIPQAKLRPIIQVPASVTFLPTAQQVGLPAGWTILSNTGSQIRLCNSTDPIPVSTSRTITLKVQGVTVTPPQTFSGNINFGNGTTCAAGISVAGDLITDNSATSTVQVVAPVPLVTLVSPYVLPVATAVGATTTSMMTVPETICGYRMAGIPDGLGAYDNNDGTFTLLMNHELSNAAGVVRAHGGIGAFVSKWIINKSNLSIVSGSDLITSVYGWDTTTQSSNTSTGAFSFNRFCSADLPAVSAYYNAGTGLGTQERLFMHGEEGGATGYQLATVASGPNSGKAYILGKFNVTTNGSGLTGIGAWENALANPYQQNKTIVVGTNDGGTGVMNNSVAVYVGTKTNTGSEVDRAGLTNGTLKFVNVTGSAVEIVNTTTRATNITSGAAFTLSGTTSTTFSRPEDGAWDPTNPSKFYFATTDRLDQVADGIGTQIGRSRLWRLNFTDITNPDLGGTIDLLLDGTEGQNMMDNIGFDNYGHIMLQEDPGNAAHNAKIWQYTIATDSLKQITKHDPARFGDIGVPATAPFTQDEETSGIIDVSDILGAGNFLLVDQAHYTTGIPVDAVEGGQLLKLFYPDTTTYSGPVTLNLKVFIEGFYNASTGNMNPVLSLSGLPNPVNQCDTMTVELHNSTLPYALAYSYTGVILTNGNINCTYPAAAVGNSYYIVLRHRNSVETWSANPFTISTVCNYDFTTSASQAYGDNQTLVDTAIWAIYSGDINQDENLDLLDLTQLELDVSNFQFGYYNTDVNGDGNVDLLDIPVVEININNFVFSNHP